MLLAVFYSPFPPVAFFLGCCKMIAKAYPFVLLHKIILAHIDAWKRGTGFPSRQYLLSPPHNKGKCADIAKFVKRLPNNFPYFLEQLHIAILPRERSYDPFFYRYLAYQLFYSCLKEQVVIDWNLQHCLLDFSDGLHHQCPGYKLSYLKTPSYMDLVTTVKKLHAIMDRHEQEGISRYDDLPGIENMIGKIYQLRRNCVASII